MAAAVHIGFLFFIIFFSSGIHVIISLTHHGDGVVLQALKNSWQNTPASWNQSNDPCGLPWKGVKCNSESRVIQLTLARSTEYRNGQIWRFSPTTSLKGNLGGVIGDLTELQTLDLSGNMNLTGPLPPQLANLSNLHSLILNSCSFTGSIPDGLGNLSQLLELDLSRNKLSGKIPPSLGKLSNLLDLALMHNQLSGLLPVSTGKTPGLDLLLKAELMDLSYNEYLTGPLPPQLGNLSNLKDLYLSGNKYLTGPLPPQLGNLRNLNTLSLAYCNFTGSIPDELGNLTQLSELDLSANKLSGKIPPSLGKLSNLRGLALMDNQLSGQLPGLDLLLKVEFIRLDKNALSGEIPSTISNLTNIIILDLAHNKLSGALPDLSKMASLCYLILSNNSFAAAEAPTWFMTLPSLKFLYMEYGSFHGPVPTILFTFPGIQRVKLRNNAFNGTLTISKATISSTLSLVDLQNNQISAVSIDFNSTNLIKLAGNPICAKSPPNTSYCHQ